MSDLYRRTATEIAYYTKISAVRFFPVFMIYAIGVIGLLKLSQVVLGWGF